MIDRGMDFELMLRLVLGNKAYHTASAESFDQGKRDWLSKVAKKIIKRIDQFDTTTRHKQRVTLEAECLFELVRLPGSSLWEIVYVLLRLCGRLIGFDYLRGSIVHTPIYHQNHSQYYTSHILQGGDVMQDYYDGKDIVSIKARIANELKEEALSDFKISMILNTSEYQVKKLRKKL